MAARSGAETITTNLGQFLGQTASIDRESQEKMSDFYRLLVLKIFRLSVLGTPVDTGRARGSLQFGVNRIPVGLIEARAAGKSKKKTPKARRTKLPGMTAAGARAIKEAAAKASRANYWDIIYFASNLEYFPFLEEGISKQAPEGIIGPATRRIGRSFRGTRG